MNEVLRWLTQDEVNYPEAARLGPEALPLLLDLVRAGNPPLATKAAYLASLIRSDGATEVVKAAAASHEPTIRVAAASGLSNLAEAAAGEVFDTLKSDSDVGVRKVSVKSLGKFRSPAMAAKIEQFALHEREATLRDLATTVARQMR